MLPAMSDATVTKTAAKGAQVILVTLAAGQFLMALDSSVMNVSIATVAEDVGTTVTGIQGAITAYTLVMAMLMIPGAKVGALIGRKRAFMIGCVIYGCGSFTTAISAEPAGAAVRLVLPRGRRRGADPAVDRGAGRRQLPAPRGVPRPTGSWPPPGRSRSPSAR